MTSCVRSSASYFSALCEKWSSFSASCVWGQQFPSLRGPQGRWSRPLKLLSSCSSFFNPSICMYRVGHQYRKLGQETQLLRCPQILFCHSSVVGLGERGSALKDFQEFLRVPGILVLQAGAAIQLAGASLAFCHLRYKNNTSAMGFIMDPLRRKFPSDESGIVLVRWTFVNQFWLSRQTQWKY